MFIELNVAFFSTSTVKPEDHVRRYFDAHRIIAVSPGRLEGYVELQFDDGGYEGPAVYMTNEHDAPGLVELVMQARMRPAEMLPSLYVGKRAAADDNPNNVHWSAKDREK